MDEVEEVKQHIQHTLSELPNQSVLDCILFCFSELINNAFEHGNAKDPSKHILVDVSITDQMVRITVEDEGDGFLWKERMNKELDVYNFAERGRGIMMTKMVCNDLLYNDQGNRVTCYKLLK